MGNAGLWRGPLLAVAVQIVAETVTHLYLGLCCLHFHHSLGHQYLNIYYILFGITIMYLHSYMY